MGDDERPDYGEPDYYEPDYEDDSPEDPLGPPFIRWPRDPQLDPAKADLKSWFASKPGDFFMGVSLK